MQHLDDGLLHALVDGEVASTELAAIQEHLDRCAECRSRLDDARQVASESGTLIELIEVPTRSPADTGVRSRRTGSRRSWIRPAMLAASLVLAVGLGYAGGVWRSPQAASLAAPIIDTVFVPAESDRQAAETPAPVPSRTQTVMRQPPPAPAEADQQADRTRAEPLNRAIAPPQAQARQRSTDSMAASARSLGFRLRDSTLRLEELVVTGTAAKPESATTIRARSEQLAAGRRTAKAAEAPAAPAPAATLEERVVTTVAATQPVTFIEAVALLGGQIRLIDGLVPNRLEVIGRAVRVIYALQGGEVVLEQRRDADSITVVLTAPWLAADSLGKLREKISH